MISSSVMSDDHFPKAYFITFTAYGNWVHADARGSVDREHNEFATPRIKPNIVKKYINFTTFLKNQTWQKSGKNDACTIRSICIFTNKKRLTLISHKIFSQRD